MEEEIEQYAKLHHSICIYLRKLHSVKLTYVNISSLVRTYYLTKYYVRPSVRIILKELIHSCCVDDVEPSDSVHIPEAEHTEQHCTHSTQ